MKFRVAHEDETKAARFRALDLCVPIRVGDVWDVTPLGLIWVDGFTRKVSLENGSGFDTSDDSGTIPWPLVYIHTKDNVTRTWAGAPFFKFGRLVTKGEGEEWSPQIERKKMDEHAEKASIKAMKEAVAFLKKVNVPVEQKADKQRTLSELEFALQLLPVFPRHPTAIQASVSSTKSPSRR